MTSHTTEINPTLACEALAAANERLQKRVTALEALAEKQNRMLMAFAEYLNETKMSATFNEFLLTESMRCNYQDMREIDEITPPIFT